jgi:multiple sugar transport system permease protein
MSAKIDAGPLPGMRAQQRVSAAQAFSALVFGPSARRIFFGLALLGVCLLFAFPVLWLFLTSLRPQSGVYYVHKGLEFTLESYTHVLGDERLLQAFFNSALVACLATVFSIMVTVSSGYMLSRFRGPIASGWFGLIYVFRCVPYITWVLPLYFVAQNWGVYDTYIGLLLPHIAVHICFFSWLMKGFFDGIDPSMEQAALIDGCTRWGAFRRVALPSAMPAISALAVLCWLFTWNEFLFALILTGRNTPMITVVMAQFVSEMGLEWNLMSATAMLAMVPAFLLTLFGQKYVIRGLRI